MISGLGDPERSRQAMASVEKWLIDREHRLILLLTPPFDQAEPNPGYIKGYVPGVRENGGQYTHAALWVVLAQALLRRGDVAHELLSFINPIQPVVRSRWRRSAIASSRTRWRPTSIPRPAMSGAAAGPGTPAPPAGCIA